MINKGVYIAETASRILAGMCSNPDKEPSPESALRYAEKLWEELEKKAYPDNFKRIGIVEKRIV